MEILAHRGVHDCNIINNSMEALCKALEMGFGIETDIRDYGGKLVISHNIADSNSILFEDFLLEYTKREVECTLALNIKCDGLQDLVKTVMERYAVNRYFFFDMSIPEMVMYKRYNMSYYTRHSDIEHQCIMYDDAIGVWIDGFFDISWINVDTLQAHLDAGKQICIVSPEIHGMKPEGLWRTIKQLEYKDNAAIKICTDIPNEVRRYFYDD